MKLTILNKDFKIIKIVDSPYTKKLDEIITNYETHHEIGKSILELKPKTNKQKIEDGEIIIDNITTFYNEEFDNIVTINEDQKYENGQIIEKTLDDLLGEGKITIEEYNEKMIENRVNSYKETTDPIVLELIQEILIHQKEQLPEELRIKIEELTKLKLEIKSKFPKAK